MLIAVLRNLINGRKVPRRVIRYWEWASLPTPQNIRTVSFDELKSNTRQKADIEFPSYLEAQSKLEEPIALIVDHFFPGNSLNGFPQLAQLNLNFEGQGRQFEVADRRLQYMSVSRNHNTLTIANCFIKKLHINSEAALKLIVRDSVIGTMVFSPHAFPELEIRNSAIINVNMGAKSPFLGNVIIKQLWLARDVRDGAGSIHDLRLAREYLMDNNNSLAAGVFHSAELALDRHNERTWSRIFSWIYEFFADYGNSISRPIIWFWVIYAVIAALVFFGQGVEIGDKEIAGWQKGLSERPWLQAIVYPFLAIFNPLGVIGKTLLVAKCWQWSAIFTPLALIGTTCVAFALIGVRRRFRLE